MAIERTWRGMNAPPDVHPLTICTQLTARHSSIRSSDRALAPLTSKTHENHPLCLTNASYRSDLPWSLIRPLTDRDSSCPLNLPDEVGFRDGAVQFDALIVD